MTLALITLCASPFFFGLNTVPVLTCNTSQESSTGSTSSYVNIGSLGGGGYNWRAIKFTADATYTACKVVARLAKVGSYSVNLTARIYDDSSGSPGSVVGTASSTLATSGIGSSEQDVTFTDLSASLTSGTTYWLSINASAAGDASNYIQWFYVFDADNGVEKYSSNGTAWNADSSNARLKFILYSN